MREALTRMASWLRFIPESLSRPRSRPLLLFSCCSVSSCAWRGGKTGSGVCSGAPPGTAGREAGGAAGVARVGGSEGKGGEAVPL